MGRPESNYPTLSALFADMEIIAREAYDARQTVTVEDFRRAGLSANGVVLDATEGVRRAFSDSEIRDFAGRRIAKILAEKKPAGDYIAREKAFAGLTRPEIGRRFPHANLTHDALPDPSLRQAVIAQNAATLACGFFAGLGLVLAAAKIAGVA